MIILFFIIRNGFSSSNENIFFISLDVQAEGFKYLLASRELILIEQNVYSDTITDLL